MSGRNLQTIPNTGHGLISQFPIALATSNGHYTSHLKSWPTWSDALDLFIPLADSTRSTARRSLFLKRIYVHYVMSYIRSSTTVSERTPELGFRMYSVGRHPCLSEGGLALDTYEDWLSLTGYPASFSPPDPPGLIRTSFPGERHLFLTDPRLILPLTGSNYSLRWLVRLPYGKWME